MYVFKDFICSLGHIEEKFLDNKLNTSKCDICGEKSVKKQTAIRFRLNGTSGDFPSATAQWHKKRQQQLKIEEKQEASRGE